MTLRVGGRVIATTRRRADDWWEVSYWPRFLDHDRAVAALIVTELLEAGYRSDDPLVVALREELA